MNNKEIEIIGIDHGYKNMKTANHIFPTAISRLANKPDELAGILEYEDEIYTIHGESLSSVNTHNKSESKEFYLLTLVSIAKELHHRGVRSASLRIAAGLPQRWYLAQKDEFKQFLMQNQEITFRYEGISYHVTILSVNVYTQGFAAYTTRIAELNLKRFSDFVLVDIGGETIDIVPVQDGVINQAECRIDTKASIWLLREISNAIESELYEPVSEHVLLNMLLNCGRDIPARNKYEQIIQKEMEKYSSYVFTKLKEFKINLDLVPVVFIGGGGSLIQKYGNYNESMTYFINDLRANAQGYELIENAVSRRG